MKKQFILIFTGLTLLLVAGCNALTLPPESTAPSSSAAVSTPAPLPPLGEPEPLDAAFCMEPAPGSHDADYSLLRFFPSGVVLQVTVQGQKSREATWAHIAPYLKETATDKFSHGEYQYSDGQIRFALAPANSDETAGTVAGRIEGDKMILQQQGTEMIYIQVYGGKTK